MCEALQNAIFPYCDNKYNWFEAREEWLIDGEDEALWEDNERCVCGQHITRLKFIVHKRTGERLQIGSECINQFEVLKNLCERCNVYEVPKNTSKYCEYCRRNKTRVDTTILRGTYRGERYDDAFAEDKGLLKWELEEGIYDYDTHFRKYLQNKIDRNTDGFRDIQPTPPNYEKLYANWIITFGKYRHKKFSEVWKDDKSYCRWVANLDTCPQDNFKKYCKYVLRI